ncbi:MAG: Wzz/FepE/Etk N-terminal domain-containing protein [Syntrophales bacterium]|nr:Wzz/FepE/Etk N-terminal domain-containing protein [Syntrophales bacterium]
MQEDPKKPKIEEIAPACPPPIPPGYASPMPVEEDEINLIDLFIVLLKHKVMIFSVVILTGISAVVVSLTIPNIYRSESTIAPTTPEKSGDALSALGGLGAMIAFETGITAAGSLELFDVVLKSRELTNAIARKYNLLPILFEKSWDAENKRWKVKKPPTLQDAYLAVQGLLKVAPDKKQNIMRLSVEMNDPLMAQRILNYYVVGLSEFLRQRTLEEAAAQQAQLSQQLAKTTDPLLKNRLYELIARQIEKETLAKVQKYFSFNVIDAAFVPEKKFKPKRAQICILSVVVAFFIAVFLAFFLEYMHNLKTREDPERLANLRRSLRFRQKLMATRKDSL